MRETLPRQQTAGTWIDGEQNIPAPTKATNVSYFRDRKWFSFGLFLHSGRADLKFEGIFLDVKNGQTSGQRRTRH